MEATSDRRACTQSRRGSPAKQGGPATQTTRVRRLYRRQAGAIPLVVRDTPHCWAAPRAAAQKRGHLALPMDKCGDSLQAGTPRPGSDTASPSTCGSGSRGTGPRAVGGTGCPLGKTFFLHCQRRHPELPKIPTYLPPLPPVVLLPRRSPVMPGGRPSLLSPPLRSLPRPALRRAPSALHPPYYSLPALCAPRCSSPRHGCILLADTGRYAGPRSTSR